MSPPCHPATVPDRPRPGKNHLPDHDTPAAATPLSDAIAARIGKRGLIALERLMGMLLVAISVEMFLSGLTRYTALLPAG